MSAFVSSPKGLHVGLCQNLLMDGSDHQWRYCLAPVIGLGSQYPTDRDICVGCRMRSTALIDGVLDKFVSRTLADDDAVVRWDQVNRGNVDSLRWRIDTLLASGAPLSKIYRLRSFLHRHETMRERLMAGTSSHQRDRLDL